MAKLDDDELASGCAAGCVVFLVAPLILLSWLYVLADIKEAWHDLCKKGEKDA